MVLPEKLRGAPSPSLSDTPNPRLLSPVTGLRCSATHSQMFKSGHQPSAALPLEVTSSSKTGSTGAGCFSREVLFIYSGVYFKGNAVTHRTMIPTGT